MSTPAKNTRLQFRIRDTESTPFAPTHSSSRLGDGSKPIPSPRKNLLEEEFSDNDSNFGSPEKDSNETITSTPDKTILENYKEETTTPTNIQKTHTQTMDITVANASVSDRTPATPRFLEPSVFNPCNSNAVDFMKEYKRCAEINGWSEVYKIHYLASFLVGHAAIWFSQYKEDQENKSKNWDSLCKDFITEYGGMQPYKSIRTKLNYRRQQQNEDIKAYYYDKAALCQEVNPKTTFEDFRDRLEMGLHESFQDSYNLFRRKWLKGYCNETKRNER